MDFARFWPVLIYVPSVLLVLATLSLITGIWDRREARKRARDQVR